MLKISRLIIIINIDYPGQIMFMHVEVGLYLDGLHCLLLYLKILPNLKDKKRFNLWKKLRYMFFFYKYNVYKHTKTWILTKNKHIDELRFCCVYREIMIFFILLHRWRKKDVAVPVEEMLNVKKKCWILIFYTDCNSLLLSWLIETRLPFLLR